MTRILHSIPRGQLNDRPGNGDLNGKASHELSISCTICSVLPQEMIYIY